MTTHPVQLFVASIVLALAIHEFVGMFMALIPSARESAPEGDGD